MKHLLHHFHLSGKVARYGCPALIAALSVLIALPAQAFRFGPFGRPHDDRTSDSERPFDSHGGLAVPQGLDFRVGLQFAGLSGFADGGFNGIAYMTGGSYVTGDAASSGGRGGGEGGREGGGPGGGGPDGGERMTDAARSEIGTSVPVPNRWTVLRLENPLNKFREIRKMRRLPPRHGKHRDSGTRAARAAFITDFSAPVYRPADPDRLSMVDLPPLELHL